MKFEYNTDIDNYLINGFMIVDGEHGHPSYLAYGLFRTDINKNYLSHFNISFDNKNFYVLTDYFTINQLLKTPQCCHIKEIYELNELTEEEKHFYLCEDETHQIYKNLLYSVFPDCEPKYDY